MARLAIFVVSILALAGCTGSGSDPTPSGASPAASEGTSSGPPASLSDLPVGELPQVPYVDRARYVTPDGVSRGLPTMPQGVSGIVPFAGGLLVADAAFFEGTNGLVLVRRGGLVSSWPGSRGCSRGVPIASTAGFVAWVTVRCPESDDVSAGAIHRARADGSMEVVQPIGADLDLAVGFLGPRVVYDRGFAGGAWVTDFRHPPTRIPGVDSVRAVSGSTGLLIGQRGDAARLVIDDSGALRWRLQTGSLVAFSPDGTRVLAIDGQRLLILWAEDGSTELVVDLPSWVDPWATEWAWEPGNSLLMVATEGDRSAIVRVDPAGELERATALAANLDSGGSPYVLIRP